MKLLKVAGAALNQTPMDWDNNKANILEAIKRARAENITLLCLPELCISGYGCEDAFFAPSLQQKTLDILFEVLPETKGMIVSIGVPVFYRNALFNTACLIADGKILGFAAKKNLAGDGVHYEPRWFKAWQPGVYGEVEIRGGIYPIGDIYFNTGGVKIGFEICEDAWVASRPGGELSLLAVDIILNPSASHFAFGKNEVRKGFVLEGSRAFGVSYIYSNLLGCEAGKIIYDGGTLIAAGGKLIASGKRFSFDNVVITSAIIDISLTRMNQSRLASFRPILKDDAGACIKSVFNFPEAEPEPEVTGTEKEDWETSLNLKKEEFTRAVTLALFDYLRKSRNKGFVVSLSGGADSSAVALLVNMMVEFGISNLGLQGFKDRLGYIQEIQAQKTAKEMVKVLLACAYQATRNSGEITRNASRKLAEAIGADFYEFDIDKIVEEYKSMVEKGIGRKLTWEQDDIALQNIQARVRSPGIWMLANIRNALLLTTSNRSEAAVGYATMDGDTSGGLCPIGGIDKAFLRQWLAWMEKEGPVGYKRVSELSYVNEQQPTAELRPKGEKQTDEKDLMPYTILDAIERIVIRDKREPSETYELIKKEFGEHFSDHELHTWVKRFFRLWCINQWKRERYAPAFHVDDKNLDPKTWCRFPILSGGYIQELNELDEKIGE